MNLVYALTDTSHTYTYMLLCGSYKLFMSSKTMPLMLTPYYGKPRVPAGVLPTNLPTHKYPKPALFERTCSCKRVLLWNNNGSH